MEWTRHEPLTVVQRRALIEDWERDWRLDGDVIYGVFVDDEVAGGSGLHHRGSPDELEIGYWTHPAFLRRGIATSVARLLTDAAFSVPGIEAVEIHHDKANLRSRGVPAGGAPDGDGVGIRQTLVFDEVDAGIGGEAALAVGRALADLTDRYQVLVVTHLPQVAAFADQQIAVRKDEVDGRTVASIALLGDAERVVELSRMLSGQPDSETARVHAEELLTLAGHKALNR
jgi:hypothetical protein